MDSFSPATFFSLQKYAHRDLWEEGKPVWFALQQLKDYFFHWKQYRIEIAIPPGVYLERPELIAIGKGTILEPGVYIQGPCILGKGCIVRHGAYLRDLVVCGDHCAIGHSAELKGAILLDQANATHFTYVGDSILGNGVNLGAGVKCANLRLDRKEVSVIGPEGKVKTGLRKMGAIVGDYSQIGCNSVLNPGTLLRPKTLCPALSNISGTIAAGSTLK